MGEIEVRLGITFSKPLFLPFLQEPENASHCNFLCEFFEGRPLDSKSKRSSTSKKLISMLILRKL